MALFKGKLLKAGKLFAGKLFGFTLELIVAPFVPGGGFGGSTLIPDLRDYRVTIRITRKNKVWEQSYITDQTGLATLERVVVTFKGIKRIFADIAFVLTHPIINIKKVIVSIKRKIK